MLSVEDSAHRSLTESVSLQENSAHRSSDSAHRSGGRGDEAITETISVPAGTLAPVLDEINGAWWKPRRYTMSVHGHRYGERVRVMRFFTRRARDRAMRAYLDAHARVYRFWYSGIPIS